MCLVTFPHWIHDTVRAARMANTDERPQLEDPTMTFSSMVQEHYGFPASDSKNGQQLVSNCRLTLFNWSWICLYIIHVIYDIIIRMCRNETKTDRRKWSTGQSLRMEHYWCLCYLFFLFDNMPLFSALTVTVRIMASEFKFFLNKWQKWSFSFPCCIENVLNCDPKSKVYIEPRILCIAV